jgi:hypothetical protein
VGNLRGKQLRRGAFSIADQASHIIPALLMTRNFLEFALPYLLWSGNAK